MNYSCIMFINIPFSLNDYLTIVTKKSTKKSCINPNHISVSKYGCPIIHTLNEYNHIKN